MKTERQRPQFPVNDDILLAEEILVVLPSSRQPTRMLLGAALPVLYELIHQKRAFEIRRLNQDVLASFDGESYSGRAEILTTIRPVVAYMEKFANAIGAAVAESLYSTIRADILAELQNKVDRHP